jgi:hypothetical protein
MGLMAFDPDSSSKGELQTRLELPEIQTSQPEDIARAVADLRHNGCLTHTFGAHGEWEVRTTLVANRRAWRYRSTVLVHGKETRKDFSTIEVDRTRQIRQTGAVTEAVLATFAREAAEVHLARCASVAEYTMMTSIFSPPVPRHHWPKKLALVLLSIAVLSISYWLWVGAHHMGPAQPGPKPPPHSVRWQPLQVAYQSAAGEPFVFSLPPLERIPEGISVQVTLEPSGNNPSWLQLDDERFQIHGTAPRVTEAQTHRLIVRAHAEPGGDSRLLVLLTITAHPEKITPSPQLRGHWTW